MSTAISKQQSLNDPDSFTQLYQLGLQHIQRLGGHIWTDYNLHDPGVTILEQVCFSLTDLIYRCDFPVEDYLQPERGPIDYKQKGLMPATDILAAPPLHASDFSTYLQQRLDELETVYVVPSSDPVLKGCYNIDAKLTDHAHQACQSNPASTPEILHRLAAEYHRIRPLGADLESVQLIPEVGLELIADIEVATHWDDQNELAASIYLATSRWLQHARGNETLTPLATRLMTLPGIIHIHRLALNRYDTDSGDTLPVDQIPAHAWLMLPEDESHCGLQLTYQGYDLDLDMADIGFFFRQHQEPVKASPLNLYRQPQGQPRHLSTYQSVQNLFPRNYHLTRGQGIHHNTQEQADRHQLRSYLLLFDQLMANFCADLAGIQQLFSTSLDAEHSYHVKQLTDNDFTAIEQHYPANSQQKLAAIRNLFDDYPERKGRVFDYLLALYGEQYPSQLHRQFNGYYDSDTFEHHLLQCKQQFIQQITMLTAKRGLGANLLEANDPGGYSQRLTMLLDMQPYQAQSFTRTLTQHLLNVVDDDKFTYSSSGRQCLFQLSEHTLSELFDLPAAAKPRHLTAQIIRQLRADVQVFAGQTLPQSLLQQGTDRHRYRIQHRSQEGEYLLFFKFSDPTTPWLYIGRHRQLKKLIRYADYLQQWLTRLNKESEGLYAIDHITLRARAENTFDSAENCAADTYRISIIMPGFTARHHNPLFRQAAENLIARNTPAHLSINFLWLPFYPFNHFETLYRRWRQLRATEDSASQIRKTDRAAHTLRQFLAHPQTDEELQL